MNTSEDSKRKHENVDQFDDLTRFLDEDFDTDDVDLFEFTTEEDSPLTGLKSIVLSLDWEITDDTLRQLGEEIERLKKEEMFLADKVSQVYLQGLSKIGHYIQNEGAHAHPNAIKLLLTFYYDFEKILSSETITGPEITALLKADVRKFKILQYQIAKRHGVEAPVPAVEEAKKMGLVYTDSEALRGIRAVILELDWEVTDDGLERLAEQLNKLSEKFTDDRYIQVLLKGLYTIKSYITEEKGRAHPEAYTLLHTFSEGIARLIENGDLSSQQREEIIVDQINGLNNLKSLIAGTLAGVQKLEDEAIEELGEEAVVPDDEQLVLETESIPTEVEEAPAVAEALVEEEFDEDEEELGEDLEIAPALADDEAERSEIEEETPPEELTAKLESFFGPDETPAEPEPVAAVVEEEPAESEAVTAEEIPPAFAGDEEEIAPALADDEAEGTEIAEEAPPEELEERLEFFFGEDEPVAPPPPPEPELTAEPEVKEEKTVAEVEQDLEPFDEESLEADIDIEPALAGDVSEGTEIQEEAPPEELTERLEFFFGTDEEVATFEEKKPSEEEKEEEVISALSDVEEEVPGEDEIVPALSGSPEEAGYGVERDEGPPVELADKLEDFFGEKETAPQVEEKAAIGLEAMFEEEEPEEEIAPALADEREETIEDVAPPASDEIEEIAPALFEEEEEAEEEIAPALEGEGEGTEIVEEAPPDELTEKLEFFFGDDKEAEEEKEEPAKEQEEELLLTPDLTEKQEAVPAATEGARPIKTEEEYQAAVVQIRTHFKKIEESLKQEIKELMEEVERLRAQLK